MRLATCLTLCLTALAACNDPAGLTERQASPRVVAVASASYGSCALTAEAAIWCWVLPDAGSSTFTRLWQVATPEPLVSLAGGVGTFSNQYCGQTRTGAVYCWGSAHESSSALTYALGGVAVKLGDFLPGALAVGTGHACALAADSTARCWGFYGSGKRGTPVGPPPDFVPNAVQGGEHFRALAAGDAHTCGIRTDGTVACWGDGYALVTDSTALDPGSACIPSPACSPDPHPVLAQVGARELAAGGRRSCIIGSGGLTCWGTPWQVTPGTLRAGTGGAVVDVALPETPVAAAVGVTNACALTVGGSAWCWGDYGPVVGGDSATVGLSAPTRIPFAGTFESLTVGSSDYCGVTTHGAVYCWGITSDSSFNAVPLVTPVRIPIPRS